jgi:hypothetical protein
MPLEIHRLAYGSSHNPLLVVPVLNTEVEWNGMEYKLTMQKQPKEQSDKSTEYNTVKRLTEQRFTRRIPPKERSQDKQNGVLCIPNMGNMRNMYQCAYDNVVLFVWVISCKANTLKSKIHISTPLIVLKFGTYIGRKAKKHCGCVNFC